MEKITEIVQWILTHWREILQVIAEIIAAATIIVKLTPTLKDDNIFLPIVKFLGKYIALNKTVNDADRPK